VLLALTTMVSADMQGSGPPLPGSPDVDQFEDAHVNVFTPAGVLGHS
jgi:hypothetical protein